MTCEHCGAPTRWVDGWKLDQCIESKMDFFVKIRELRAQVAALEPDAARYRWLRDWATSSDWEYIGFQTDINAAIAEVAARKGGGMTTPQPPSPSPRS